MLFVIAIILSLSVIGGSFTTSWLRIIEIFELENSDAMPAPKIRVGKPIYYTSSPLKINAKDNIIIAFPREVETLPTKDGRLPEAA